MGYDPPAPPRGAVVLPKWAIPPKGDGDEFQTDPFSRGEIAVHVAGALLNGVPTLAMIALLAGHLDALAAAWPWTLAMILAGLYAADFVSGLLHWAFDTWFNERNNSVRRMVLLVREHHIYPGRIFSYGIWYEAGVLSWFALVLSWPLFTLTLMPGLLPAPERYSPAVAGVTVSLCVVFMLEFHKVGHRVRRGRLVRLLQRSRLLLSAEHHLRHHAREHDGYYCLINGWADLTLGSLGIFRALERILSAVTGAIPRENDREWRRRYGRYVRPAA